MPAPSPPRAILHVDMDAFYASVEQRDNPELRGKPLIVGGTGARGVVAAASYEVRVFGVHSAMPMRQALMLCPQAICVPPRMSCYQQVSRQVFAIFGEFTPQIEGLSLDEAFLDVTHSAALKGDASAIARDIKTLVRTRLALTASVGVAPNKLVAKIASDLGKPDGLTVVTSADIHSVLDPLPVTRLPGLGRKKGAAVVAAGIRTLGELRRASDAQLWPLFGRAAAAIRGRAAGQDERPVVAHAEEKSVGAEETFEHDIADPARLHRELLQLADRTSARLRAARLAAGCITLKIRQHDFTTQTRQRSFTPASSDSRVIATVADSLLAAWLGGNRGARLRLLGVSASDFAAGPLAEPSQSELFAQRGVADGLDATLDRIRGRFGATSVTRAGRLRRP